MCYQIVDFVSCENVVNVDVQMTSTRLRMNMNAPNAIEWIFSNVQNDFKDDFSQFQILPLQLQPRHSITHSVPYPSSSSSSVSIVTDISSSTTSDEYYLQQSLRKSSVLTDNGSYLWKIKKQKITQNVNDCCRCCVVFFSFFWFILAQTMIIIIKCISEVAILR